MTASHFRIAVWVTLLLFVTCFVHAEGPWAAAAAGDSGHHAQEASTAGGEAPDSYGAGTDCGLTGVVTPARTLAAQAAVPAGVHLVLPPAFGAAAWHRRPSLLAIAAIRAGPLQPPLLKGVLLRI
jgi:hypothetical protein